ncbi:MAG: stage II sporulation protein M [Acidilobaceae archaeon]
MSRLLVFMLDSRLIYAWVLLTLIFGLFAVIASAVYPLFKGSIEDFISSFIESRLPGPSINPFLILSLILVNNSIVVIVVGLLSITVLVPLAVLAFNGAIVGFIISLTNDNMGLSYPAIFILLAPHGIIEVPAIALVSSVFIAFFIGGLKLFISILPRVIVTSLIMIFVAAIIESTVTLMLGLIFMSIFR